MKIKQLFLVLLICLSFGATKAFAMMSADDLNFVGKEAPNFTARTLIKDEVSLNEYREGKKAMVFFWATWCPSCRKEIATLTKKMGDLKKKGIKLIMINVGESPQKVRAFLDKNKIEEDVFLDPKSTVAATYRIVGLPTIFYVNEKGVINAMENGLLDNYEEVLAKE